MPNNLGLLLEVLRANGKIRNHGYPWRLVRAEFLDQLFTFQIKLR